MWLDNDYRNSKNLSERVTKVKQWREQSDRSATVKLASVPHKFAEIRQPDTPYLAFPTISSERREYIPAKFYEPHTIASNQIYVVPNAELWHFAILSSSMHMSWIKAIGGRLKSDYRYSAALLYNTFPLPSLTDNQKDSLSELAIEIIATRENYPEHSLAKLYDPELMPTALKEAHRAVDKFVCSLYSKQPLLDDDSRLATLLNAYHQMIVEEK
ncbi:hypothetical protein D5E79_22750 [Vibrio parahaemolyticus]|nr:hypothetical protein D5E79_22750 [Vibrio parahaemolyticus]